MQKTMISPREISRKFNISYQTINHYTNLGILVVRQRKGNGRLYDQQEVKKAFRRVNELKNVGYPLRLIRTML